MGKKCDSLVYLIGSLNITISKIMNELFDMHNINLTKEQWVILKVLKSSGPLTQTEITHQVQKDKTTITRAVDALTKNEYVVRTKDPDDRRVHIIKLTDKALETLKKMVPIIKEHTERATSYMSDKEYIEFKKNLMKIKDNLLGEE